MHRAFQAPAFVIAVLALSLPARAQAAELSVLTAGACKQVLVALAPSFEARTGHRLVLANDTVGALARRIENGAAFDVAVLSPGALTDLAAKGLVRQDGMARLARVGIGVAVPEGAPVPDISTTQAFVAALRAAKTVAYIDPASGGSSGVYVTGLFERLGLAGELRAKSVLVKGGYVAEHVAKGEATLGIHQISEILPVAGVRLVGPLPEELQNYTVYAAGIGAASARPEEAAALIAFLRGPEAREILTGKGMMPVE